MIVKSLTDRIIFPKKEDVLKVHLYMKFLENKIPIYENDISIIVLLYNLGGYSNSMEQSEFFDLCLEKKFKLSKQSIRNTLSTYTSAGVLVKRKNVSLKVSEKFIPDIEFDKLILKYIITHAE